MLDKCQRSGFAGLRFELLIDEDEVVRATIIRVMGARKLNGWLKVMSRSLLTRIMSYKGPQWMHCWRTEKMAGESCVNM